MKKILYVTTVSRTINAFLVPHIKYLLDLGYKVDCACNVDQAISGELIARGVRVFNVPYQRTPFSRKNFRALSEIKEIQDVEKYDIMHVHTPVAAFFTRLIKRNFPNIKVVYTCHGFHFFKGSSMLSWILFYTAEKIAARWTDIIVTINEEDFQNAKRLGYEANRVFKVNGVGIEDFILRGNETNIRNELGLSKCDFIITVIAELNINKNQIQLIKAMNKLSREYKDIKVLFVGDGDLYCKLKNKIKQYNLEKSIFLLGYRTDVINIISNSDIIGLFSKREGLPRCLMEGMSLGKPLIVTNNRGNRELVVPSENGYMVKIGDVKETCKAIKNMYNNKGQMSSMGEKSKELVNKFCLNKVLDQLNFVYNSIF